jgi:hypothetical protein
MSVCWNALVFHRCMCRVCDSYVQRVSRNSCVHWIGGSVVVVCVTSQGIQVGGRFSGLWGFRRVSKIWFGTAHTDMLVQGPKQTTHSIHRLLQV